jgi:acetyl-CoA acetyltransferase
VTRALIGGVAETPYLRGRAAGTTQEFLARAVRGALSDARLGARDVDGLGVASFTLTPDHAADLAWRLGLRLRWLMEDTNGGASGLNLLAHAVRAVEAGDADVVVLTAGDTFGQGDFRRLADTFNTAARDHLAPIPTGGPNAVFALATRRHMAQHELERDVYGRVAVSQRDWARLNPNAAFRERLTLDDYLAAPIVADPLCLLDCVPVVSGANAVVVAAADRTRHPAVTVQALVSSFNADGQEGDGLRTGLAPEAERLWNAAAVAPDDVDVVSLYDDYPVMVLVQLADLGLVEDGDVRRLVETRIANRALPLNTSGGQLSAGQAGAGGGMHGLVESVRQLRGRAGARQVEGAEIALVSGYGMIAYRYGACANAAVLRSAR